MTKTTPDFLAYGPSAVLYGIVDRVVDDYLPVVAGLEDDIEELEREFGESKRMIEDRLGVPVRSASLPRGWEAPGLADVLRGLGYRVFCTSRVAWWHPGDEPLAMPRVPAWRGLGVEGFAAIVNAERRALWPRLIKLLPLWNLFQKQTDRAFPIVILTPIGPA